VALAAQEDDMLNEKFLADMEEYLNSGRMEEDFEYSDEERKLEMLDYLERIMDLAEKADEVATKLIFKNSQLGALLGTSEDK
jgi:hypothetical protein